MSASYDHVLAVDISRFYGTLYTHAIPWALHTKAWSKSALNTPAYNASLGAKLDKAVRKGQDNQTLGIPVGPDTSRIIAEIVGAALDRELTERKQFKPAQAYRFVDDWFVGFDQRGEAEDSISAFAAVCRGYELELNTEKTGVVSNTARVDSVWVADLREHDFGSSVARQGRMIEQFATKAFDFAERFPSASVLDYAVKRTRGMTVEKENWETYETFLLHAVRASNGVLPTVVQILTNYRFAGYVVDASRCRKLVVDIVRRHAQVGHQAEVAWALFLCKALAIPIPTEIAGIVSKVESSVCALLALDLEARGQCEVPLDKSLWLQSMTADGLRSARWLLAYEADLKGWLNPVGPSHVDASPYFRELKARRISFYDTKSNVSKIAAVAPATVMPPMPAAVVPVELSNEHADADDVEDPDAEFYAWVAGYMA